MNLVTLFLNWAAAFEETYRDDDWSRLEEFLAPDVVHEVQGAPFACVVRGRASVLAAIRRSVNGFDRRCVRTLTPAALPAQEGDAVIVQGTIAYTHGDSPPLVGTVRETATYADGRIVRLVDEYDPASAARARAWLAEWGAGLDWSYV